MDIATDKARFTTTLQIPLKLRQDIKNAGMTINGALVQGWAAMQQQKEANQLISDIRQEKEEYRLNMVKYRDRWLALMEEKKHD